MSKHMMVDGQLLQMDKSYSQLKQKQKDKIGGWMYEAFKRQTEADLSDEEALAYVFDRIEEAKIWIPDYEIIQKYRSKKKQFKNRLAGEKVPQHIFRMESILDKAIKKMDELEKSISEYEEFQSEIQELEAYYTDAQWKEDFANEEKGRFPEKLKRGVLSEDGIYNVLERNKELLARISEEE